MTASEISALAAAIVAVVSAVTSLLTVIGHLNWHHKQDQAQAQASPADNSVTPHP